MHTSEQYMHISLDYVTMITANGLTHNAYRNEVQAEITLDDLFVPII